MYIARSTHPSSPARQIDLTTKNGDERLADRVRIVALTLPGVDLSAVSADGAGGIVTLWGTASTREAKQKASLAVRCIDGVKGVRNHLAVLDHAETPAGKRQNDIPTLH